MKHNLFNIFSKPVYKNILHDITNQQLHEIKNYLENLEYHKTDISSDNTSTLSSKSHHIFNDEKLSLLKNKIMKEFIFFKNSILKYENNDFIFTTSWVAKSEKNNQSSEAHNHNNCMYSGIFYVNTDENSGDLQFVNFTDKRFNLIPTEYNIHNSTTFSFVPENKMILFFPSELFHKILKNNSNITRYSIAFNMIPVGNIGNINSDSFLRIGAE